MTLNRQSARSRRRVCKESVGDDINGKERCSSGGCVVFFFSSRRRHTRCSRDWSSDVCSSDLYFRRDEARRLPSRAQAPGLGGAVRREALLQPGAAEGPRLRAERDARRGAEVKIGRASCRGRGEISGGAGSLKKKKEASGGRSM